MESHKLSINLLETGSFVYNDINIRLECWVKLPVGQHFGRRFHIDGMLNL